MLGGATHIDTEHRVEQGIEPATVGPPMERGRTSGCSSSPDVVVLNDNGAWSWFEDQRAVVDPSRGRLIASTVADRSGTRGARRRRRRCRRPRPDNRPRGESTLHAGLEADDHNSAALFVRRDGRYVAMYSKHGTDTQTRWRVSRHPGDITEWDPEQHIDNGADTTYANVHPASTDGDLVASSAPSGGTRTCCCRRTTAQHGAPADVCSQVRARRTLATAPTTMAGYMSSPPSNIRAKRPAASTTESLTAAGYCVRRHGRRRPTR